MKNFQCNIKLVTAQYLYQEKNDGFNEKKTTIAQLFREFLMQYLFSPQAKENSSGKLSIRTVLWAAKLLIN